MISFRERWSGIAPVNVRGVGESRKIVKQTDSGFGVDAQADSGRGASGPDLPLHMRPLHMTFVMGGNSHAGSRKFWILCSSQEEFPKISFLLSFLFFFFLLPPHFSFAPLASVST